MRLAIVGSTNVTEEQLKTAKAIIQGILIFYMPQVVISGGAKGIDSLAEDEALLLNMKTVIHYPLNQKWAPNGYQARNIKIAEDCTHLLCIRTQQSTTYGSGWTADRAEELGKTVWRLTI